MIKYFRDLTLTGNGLTTQPIDITPKLWVVMHAASPTLHIGQYIDGLRMYDTMLTASKIWCTYQSSVG